MLKSFMNEPSIEVLPSGEYRITVDGISGTVSSHHLLEPKIAQIQRLSQSRKATNEQSPN
jgi:hypothetical protein